MNNLLIILLLLLFVLVILKLFFIVNEGFEVQYSKEFNDSYTKFIDFYNKFNTAWIKTLTTGLVSEVPQQPLSDPNHIETSATPPSPSLSELNAYSTKLSQNINLPLPQVTNSFSSSPLSLEILSNNIPKTTIPYQNALNYMNKQLEDAITNMDGALKGKETFEDMCQDISQCIANNPELIDKIAKAQSNQTKSNQIDLETELIRRMDQFVLNKDIMTASLKNQQLLEKADEIKRQAESGELLNQIDLPKEPEIQYTIPSGGDTLSKMKESDPTKYKQLEKDGKQWFAIKQLIEQINSNL